MLKVNIDSVGEAAIVECDGTISGGNEALQLYDAVHGAGSGSCDRNRPLKSKRHSGQRFEYVVVPGALGTQSWHSTEII